MGRRATQQMTFTKGELDPDLSERVDLEHYYDSLAVATNCLFHPQGGFSDRGGFELVSDADVIASGVTRRLRRRVTPLDVTSGMITAANGGTAANLVDQSTATVFQTNAVTSAAFVLFEVDLGSPKRVDMVDLVGFFAELAASDEAISIEYYSAGGTWEAFGDALDVPVAKHIRTTARTRRFATTPGGPAGSAITARSWRAICRDASGVVGRVSIQGLRMWAELEHVSPVVVREVARQEGTTYQLVFTERNVDVFRDMRYTASIPVPIAAQQLAEIGHAGGFDTMLLFHEMIPTRRIVRQGAHGEWDIGLAPFVNVPTLVESVVFSGDQDEIQDLVLTGIAAGDTFCLTHDDAVTAPITYTDDASLPAAVQAAIATLPGVTNAAGDLIVTLADDTPTVRVRFSGTNGNRAWPLLGIIAASAPALEPTTLIQQDGIKSTGKYFEDTTGWPRCGAFVQQRLLVAGFRSSPTSYHFSVNPNYWDFASTGSPLTADKGFGGALDVDDIEVIHEVFVGRHLQMFTQAGEWYTTAEKLDATAPVAWRRATAHGLKRGAPLVFADGATIFVQEGGQTLRDFLYTDVEQSYQAEPLSVLAPQLLTDVVDVAHRQARSVRDGNLILLVNADGSAGVVTLLRKQNVIAGAPWTTYGGFKAIMSSIEFELYAVTERDGDHWLERWTPDTPLDWSTHDVGAARSTITTAGYLEGRDDVWAIADGEVLGPFTVTDGEFELPAAAADVRFGLLPDWSVRSQVLKDKLANSQPFRGPGRIYEVELALKDTGQLAIGTNGQAHRDIPLLRLDGKFKDGGPLQAGGDPRQVLYDRLYTGNILVTGLLGFMQAPYWELSRSVPAPVHVKSMRIEAVHKGD